MQNVAEPGIGGVVVNLLDAGGGIIATTTTDANGFYAFTGLCAGTYYVDVVESTLPPTTVPSPPFQGGDTTKDSNGPLDGSAAPVTLPTDSSEDLTIDFGYNTPPPASVGDFVWLDTNGNGKQDAGESGVPGVETRREFRCSDDGLVQSMLTDASGLYLFTVAAGDYYVKVINRRATCSRRRTRRERRPPMTATWMQPARWPARHWSRARSTSRGMRAPWCRRVSAGVIAGIDLTGIVDNYLFFFTDGRPGCQLAGRSKGYVGNVLVNGVLAKERTSGGVAYAGTIYKQRYDPERLAEHCEPECRAGFREHRKRRARRSHEGQVDGRVRADQRAARDGRVRKSLNRLAAGLNTQNGVAETIVINVTSGFTVSKIYITGDAGDVFILRWDTDANFANGYQGIVKFQSGGAIVPLGGLKPSSFVHVAGDISASGGGSNPPAPYPQGPRLNDGTGALIKGGQNFSGGGFFTGYWLTTGNPTTRTTQSLSNAIFVGGWYTTTVKFSMTSGTSGVYVAPHCPNN